MINEQERSKRWELKIPLKNEPERLGMLMLKNLSLKRPKS